MANREQELRNELERLSPGIGQRLKDDLDYMKTLEFLDLARQAHINIDPDGTKFGTKLGRKARRDAVLPGDDCAPHTGVSTMTNPPLRGLEMRREFHNLTQADLGKEIGATQGHYNKLEKGTVRLDVHRAAQLAKRLGCTIEQLL